MINKSITLMLAALIVLHCVQTVWETNVFQPEANNTIPNIVQFSSSDFSASVELNNEENISSGFHKATFSHSDNVVTELISNFYAVNNCGNFVSQRFHQRILTNQKFSTEY